MQIYSRDSHFRQNPVMTRIKLLPSESCAELIVFLDQRPGHLYEERREHPEAP